MPTKKACLAALAAAAFLAPVTPAEAATARATGMLPIHAGPASGYAVIGRLADNERVDIVRCTYSGRWCFIAADGGPEGWVLSSYLVGSAAKLRATPPRPLFDPFDFDGRRGHDRDRD